MGACLRIDQAALFFVHPQNQSYFTYNYLSNVNDKNRPSPTKSLLGDQSMYNEPIFSFPKGESLISKVLDQV